MCSRIRCFLIRHTYDKPLFNCTALRLYRRLKAAAAVLDCKPKNKCRRK